MEWNRSVIEDKINLDFKHGEILRLVMLDPSYTKQFEGMEEDNQRLEFLGEGILNLVIAEYLYENCPYLEVGKYKALREKLTTGKRLTRLWYELGLGEDYPFLGMKLERHILRHRESNPFANACEALVGAIFLDRGFAQTRTWLIKYLIAPILEHHLKEEEERVEASKQRNFFSNSLLNAIVADYVYRLFPGVEPKRLNTLAKSLTSKQSITAYNEEISEGDLPVLQEQEEAVPSKPFKALLVAKYKDYQKESDRSDFSNTSRWFIDKFVDEEELVKEAVRLLLKDDKPQKWIIRTVLGYESKDYDQGRERFYELVNEG